VLYLNLKKEDDMTKITIERETLERLLHGFVWPPGNTLADAIRAALAAQPAEPVALTLAVIGHKHFGNPIPQAWYAAARELLSDAAPPAPAAVPLPKMAYHSDINASYGYSADQMRAYGAACAAAAVKHAYVAGWVACAEWAKRDDLLADIDSPAFQREFYSALSNLIRSSGTGL
jgi:hypothetical protein